MASVVLGVFFEKGNAREVISELEARGYNPKDMSILMKDTSKKEQILSQGRKKGVVGNTVAGVAAGAAIGGIAGLVAFIIPGLGSFFIGGPIIAALGLTGAAATTATGATTGAVAGGIFGALTSAFGLPIEEAKLYEDRIKEGGILVAVPTDGDEDEVKLIMDYLDADNTKIVEAEKNLKWQHLS